MADPCQSPTHAARKRANHDARGIFLCFTCPVCHDEEMAKYRPDVLTDPNYWTDEPVEGDDWL